jgi:hypothetical protein
MVIGYFGQRIKLSRIRFSCHGELLLDFPNQRSPLLKPVGLPQQEVRDALAVRVWGQVLQRNIFAAAKSVLWVFSCYTS